MCNSFKYVSCKDIKTFSKDFKNVYTAANEEAALDTLRELKEKWGRQYSLRFSELGKQLGALSPFYKFPKEIRKIIYTTNIIEGLDQQFRKVTKTKSAFPSDSSLEKMLYLASMKNGHSDTETGIRF